MVEGFELGWMGVINRTKYDSPIELANTNKLRRSVVLRNSRLEHGKDWGSVMNFENIDVDRTLATKAVVIAALVAIVGWGFAILQSSRLAFSLETSDDDTVSWIELENILTAETGQS